MKKLNSQKLVFFLFEEIKEHYVTNKEKSFFVTPDFVDIKINSFIDAAKKHFKFNLNADDILVYFDNTLFGLGSEGVAITTSHLIVTVDKLGVFPLSKIENISISGVMNKTISFYYIPERVTLNFTLTQSNEGAKDLLNILSIYVKNIKSLGLDFSQGENNKLFLDVGFKKSASAIAGPVLINKEDLLGLLEKIFDEKNEHVLVEEKISAKKEKNAREKCEIIGDEEIIGLIDTTVFGSAKNAICLTKSALYWHNDWSTKRPGPGKVNYDDLTKISFKEIDGSNIQVTDYNWVNVNGCGLSAKEVKSFLMALKKLVLSKKASPTC